MTTAFEQVKVQRSILSQECEKQGCEVGLTDVPHRFLLIDMDLDPEAGKSSKKCDYLLVGEDNGPKHDLYVVPMELKSSGFNAQAVSKQLAGGARVADHRVPKVRCRFVPLVAHGGAHRREIDKLAKYRVHFRRKPHAIKLVKCGGDIAEVFGSLSR